jgi:hypothetical protein
MESKEIYSSLCRLETWVQKANWQGYDTFDGLSSPWARFFTWNHPFLKQAWQQGVRRFPLNLRPLLGIKPGMSTKGMGFFAQGYLRLHQARGDAAFLDKARYCLEWLMQNRSPGFRGHCWGNHFDYQSRGGNIPKGTPTIVWTGLIAHAFLDAFEALREQQYFDVAKSACDFILDELGWMEQEVGVCLRYYPNATIPIHNSSMIGASLLARVHSFEPNARYREMSENAVSWTVHHQTEQGGWYYGVGSKWAWIDSFHTGYVLEALDLFCRHAPSDRFRGALEKGYDFFVNTFFGDDGTPRYYDYKTPPLDIQCASQAIQTLVHLRGLNAESIPVAIKVAEWTIRNMQDKSGYFYYRKYPLITNKTPTLHWGQATMFAALSLLDQYLRSGSGQRPASLASATPVAR